uniref:Methyltransferase-like protein n=1 Tax=Octopus bimaculoides TaxID=37653 RepID=A0A0L8I9U7_OCTBM
MSQIGMLETKSVSSEDTKISSHMLSPEDIAKLEKDQKLVSEFKQNKFERDACKNWDLFYKRNTTKFFKDRHWTTREFKDLLNESDSDKIALEVGCGVGNFLFPLLQETSLFFYACDFSKRAVEFVKVIKPGGCLLFRDYGLYDHAMLRFAPGHKLAENFYVRQDGTRAYYFSTEFIEHLLCDAGYDICQLHYVKRETVNKKEGLCVPRIFVQGKFMVTTS